MNREKWLEQCLIDELNAGTEQVTLASQTFFIFGLILGSIVGFLLSYFIR